MHHRKAGIPPFCVVVNLSYLVLLGGKSSIIDRVLDSVLPPPPPPVYPIFVRSPSTPSTPIPSAHQTRWMLTNRLFYCTPTTCGVSHAHPLVSPPIPVIINLRHGSIALPMLGVPKMSVGVSLPHFTAPSSNGGQIGFFFHQHLR